MSSAPHTQNRPGWAATLRIYAEPANLRMLALGFAAGLPLAVLLLGNLSFRLREAGIDRTTIGYLSWIGLAYGFKWTWAPLVDRLPIPWLTARLGRRRSWLMLSQVVIAAGLAGMAVVDPRHDLPLLVGCALVVAFASATQDVALDAFRIESADVDRQAALAATYQAGYRLGMIWAGAGALWLAARSEVPTAGAYQQAAWQFSYLVMAASMAVGLLTVWRTHEPVAQVVSAPTRDLGVWLREAVVEPFAEFFVRYRRQGVLILVLIGVYRISDVVLGVMAYPFFVDMGYSKDEVAAISKVYGVLMTLVGGFIGGSMALRFGVMRVLMAGAALSAASNLLYAWLAGQGHNLAALTWVISVDNLASGLASAAFIGYMSGLTQVRYSATQYALFSSLMLFGPKLLAGYSGVFVEHFGYIDFFIGTSLLGLPVLGLVWLATRWQAAPAATPTTR